MSFATIVGCGDNGVSPPDAPPDIDAPPALPAQLSLSPLTSDFGSVTVGETSTAMSFTVTNTGESDSGSISASVMGSGAANFSIETNGCTTLAANATCTVAVSFSPTTDGAKTANLVVSGSPGGSVSAALDGDGVSLGDITVTPSSNAFGNLVVGGTSATTATFTVTNTGGTTTGALVVSATGSDPGDFTKQSDTCNGNTLAANATCVITASFTPTSPGAKSASFQIDGNPGGTATATVTGTGLAQAQLSINPSLLDFGSVINNTNSANQVFTVTNTGGVASGALTAALSGTDMGQFAVVASNCSAALNPNASCSVTVQFRPTTSGSKAAQLDVSGTPGGTTSASLLGTGIPPGQIVISPAAFAYANTTVGQVSASQVFTVTNTGGAPTGALGTALGGNDPSQFTVVTSSNGCLGTVLQANGTCTIAITFSPTTGGAKAANIAVSGTPGGTATAGLTGTAIPDALLTITPTSHDFGSVGTGTQTAFQTFTVRNTGGQNSGIPTVALIGPQAAQFNFVSACTAALAPNATCTVQARFAPNIDGNAAASISVSATPGGAVTATLFGQGVDPAALGVVGSSSLNFNGGNGPAGQVLLGETQILTYTLRNNGTEPTGTISFAEAGNNQGDYSITHNCTSLPAGMTCTVTVTFAPTARDTRTASIIATATPGGSVSVSLTGVSLPRLELMLPTTNPYDFPATVINTFAPPQVTVRVRNNTRTNQAIALVNSPVFGAAANFQLNGNGCTGTLDSDDICDVLVQFEPDAVVTDATGTMTFSLGAGGVNNTAVQTVRGDGVDSMVITAVTTANFNNVARGTASDALSFRVFNPANSPTTGPIGATISSASFQIISDSCAGQTLDAMEECFIDVRFLPTTGTGTLTATLQVTASPGGSPSIVLSGTIVEQANLTFTPTTTLAFGNVFSGEISDSFVTVANAAGNAPSGPVQFSHATGDSSLFQLNPAPAVATDCINNTTVLAASQSCRIRVRFLPSGVAFGAKGTTLSISANPGVAGTKTIAVTGTSVSTLSVSAPVANPFTFGTVNQNQAGVSQVFTIRNDSNTTVSVTNAMIDPAVTHTTITNNGCTMPLTTAARTCNITVQFISAVDGVYNTALQANSANGTARRDINATVRTSPNVVWTEAGHDFGSTLAGAVNGETHTFTLTNAGQATSGALAISVVDTMNWTLTNTGAGSCSVVAAGLTGGASCTVSVKFTPMAGGTAGDKPTLLLAANVGGTTAMADLDGRLMAPGSLVLTPTFDTFGNAVVGTNGATRTFTLQNTSNSTLTFNADATTNDFDITGGTCTGSLLTGNNCTIIVRFEPTAAGARTGQLQIGSPGAFDADDTYANLSGNGQAPAAIVFSATSNAYGEVASGANELFTFTLTNTGDVSAAALTRGTLQSPDPTQFAIVSGCTTSTVLTAAGTANDHCDMVVRFNPTSTGAKASSFVMSSSSITGTNQSISLTGEGVLQATLGITPSIGQTAIPASRPVGQVDSTATEIDDNGRNFVINNGGDVPTGNLVIDLSNEVDFVIDTTVGDACVAGAPLAAGDTCNVLVRFAPNTFANGLVTTLTVSANPGMQVTNTVTGNGTSATTVSPAAQDFGNIADGSSSGTFVFVFSNNGDVDTGLLYTALGGTSPTFYTIESDDCAGQTLAARVGATVDTCTVEVRFTPPFGSAAAARNATLTVSGTPGNAATSTLTADSL